MTAPGAARERLPGDRPLSAIEQILARIELTVIRRLDGLLQGDFRTLFFGSGVDFADLREYEPSDDVRHIDWNVTARMDTPYVREYLEERELRAWLLIDRSPSMFFGLGDRTKAAAQVDLVTTLARILTNSGNRVGAAFWNDNTIERILEPRTGRNQVLQIVHQLTQTPGERTSVEPTSLADLADEMHRRARRRSLIVVVSDFITPNDWQHAFGRLTERHEVLALRLVAEGEHELPSVGIVAIKDPETGEQMRIDTTDPGFRSRLAAVVADREAALKAAANAARIDLHTISAEADLVDALARVAAHRKLRVRGRR